MSILWGEERSQGGVAKAGVWGLSGVGMVGIRAGASLCRGGESRLGDTLILPRIRAHREASHNSKLCATNHLKAGRSLYRVRTQPTISGRIALDMFRDAQSTSRAETMETLHHARLR